MRSTRHKWKHSSLVNLQTGSRDQAEQDLSITSTHSCDKPFLEFSIFSYKSNKLIYLLSGDTLQSEILLFSSCPRQIKVSQGHSTLLSLNSSTWRGLTSFLYYFWRNIEMWRMANVEYSRHRTRYDKEADLKFLIKIFQSKKQSFVCKDQNTVSC